jgi:hypothetical protein
LLFLLEKKSLTNQCKVLDLAIEDLHLDDLRNPELKAFQYFQNSGYVGSYCEGGAIGIAIKSLCLDWLTRDSIYYQAGWSGRGGAINARQDVCLRGVSALAYVDKHKLNDLYHAIRKSSKQTYLRAFNEIISYGMINEWYPGLTIEFAEALLDSLDKEVFIAIAEWLSRYPSHRNGWPDLTLVKNGKVEFVEAKTSDKLHFSQLVTIPAIMKIVPADVWVLRLKS